MVFPVNHGASRAGDLSRPLWLGLVSSSLMLPGRRWQRRRERIVDGQDESVTPYQVRWKTLYQFLVWSGMRLASMAAPTATPSTWPVMRIWATVAEALPSLDLGTEPSTELLLGLVKSPRPKPTRASLQMIAQLPARASSCVRE